MFMFMNKNYGTQIYDIEDLNRLECTFFRINKELAKKGFKLNYIKEWFQQQQEKMFKP